ncbi:MAG: chemotaxis protein CheD [Sporolactobacillus sp.]
MIHVGLSEIKYAGRPETLRSLGLGSCVGIVIYSERLHLAAMAHVMLPDSALARSDVFMPGKYADTAVPELLRILKGRGLSTGELKAKMAGGAEMFKSVRTLPLGSIGKRNVEAVHRELRLLGIPVIGEETGANYGRTVEFSTSTCLLRVRAINRDERMI